MIVDPDFFDHWRTRMVADMLKDQLAPVYIMRLWAHCQNRKGDVFDIPAAGLKALCQFPGAAQDLEEALIAAEYIARDGLTVTVTGWAEKNAALLAAWENGNKGGRPKKNPKQTDGQPEENPPVTHGLPMANPSLTQTKPIRVDKRREERNTPPTPHGGFAEFWAAFPKKVGRDAALKAFEKRKPDADLLARMLAAIAAQATSEQWRKDGGQFIPNPATWLNQARWEDAGVHLGGSGPRRDSDEYAALHRNASWWRDAGFDSVWSAISAKCWHNTAHQFRDGKRVEVAA